MNTTINKTEEKSLCELIDELGLDNIHSRESITNYIIDMINRGVIISHMLKQLEEHLYTDYFYGDLCNSMSELIPIDSVEDLNNIKERL